MCDGMCQTPNFNFEREIFTESWKYGINSAIDNCVLKPIPLLTCLLFPVDYTIFEAPKGQVPSTRTGGRGKLAFSCDNRRQRRHLENVPHEIDLRPC